MAQHAGKYKETDQGRSCGRRRCWCVGWAGWLRASQRIVSCHRGTRGTAGQAVWLERGLTRPGPSPEPEADAQTPPPAAAPATVRSQEPHPPAAPRIRWSAAPQGAPST